MTPYEISFENRPEYLYAGVRAETLDEESASQYIRDIAAKASELESERLMIYRDIPVMLPTGALFFSSAEYVEVMCRIPVAFVNPYPALRDPLAFATTVVENRGGRFKVFDHSADAEVWLLSQ